MKKKTQKEIREARREMRHYGMTKIKKGQKAVFISKQDKNGWSLGLALNTHTLWLRNVRFNSQEDVSKAVTGKIVFVALKTATK